MSPPGLVGGGFSLVCAVVPLLPIFPSAFVLRHRSLASVGPMLSMKPWISGEACCLRQTKWISLESRPATGSAWKPRRVEGMRATKLSGTQAKPRPASMQAKRLG